MFFTFLFEKKSTSKYRLREPQTVRAATSACNFFSMSFDPGIRGGKFAGVLIKTPVI